MNKLSFSLLGVIALLGATTLSGCKTETEATADGDQIISVTADDSLATVDDSLAAGADMAVDSTGAALDSAGQAIGRAAEATGNAIGRAAGDVRDAVDENVDLGHNAENQGAGH